MELLLFFLVRTYSDYHSNIGRTHILNTKRKILCYFRKEKRAFFGVYKINKWLNKTLSLPY